MAKRQKTISQLKKEAWKWFSQYIRLKDADWRGYVACYTCGEKFHWLQMDAGHYESRRYNNTLFDERNVHPQCRRCNRFLEGNKPRYATHLVQDYGPDILFELQKAAQISRQWTREELEDLIFVYKTYVKKLIADKGR